ncbi:hypothetical protein [Clostridium botulinum]|uniref:hypothetical protein n=1 Tax=Clostridium botulinum TaxID=1491 RepID=UPI0004B31BD8|nr:hypothetical protein [Clostridium botulinum]APQ71180.1 hypothetical protein RSJ8_4312 [Clostridium botulinum]MBN3379107.1 hypothetical protein [Clostridium botulinum]QDY26986.1 hypothetical protein CGQ40_19985 [Clostridium botulinum]
MLNDPEEIKEIDFEKIKTEEEFKNILDISPKEWEKIMLYSQESTDENTPDVFADIRIYISIMDKEGYEEVFNFDLVYNIKNEKIEDGYRHYDLDSLNHVIAYF